MKTKEQELPSWFNGTHYSEGSEVTNQFSGQSYYLNATELSMYDFIMGSQMLLDMMGIFNPKTAKIQQEMSKGLGWFRVNNAEAYMILLD